jgi:hypothetical protein
VKTRRTIVWAVSREEKKDCVGPARSSLNRRNSTLSRGDSCAYEFRAILGLLQSCSNSPNRTLAHSHKRYQVAKGSVERRILDRSAIPASIAHRRPCHILQTSGTRTKRCITSMGDVQAICNWLS